MGWEERMDEENLVDLILYFNCVLIIGLMSYVIYVVMKNRK